VYISAFHELVKCIPDRTNLDITNLLSVYQKLQTYILFIDKHIPDSMQISGIKYMLIKFKYVVCRFLVYTWKLNVHGVQVSSIMYTFMQ
jgi:hypothetical protein